MRKNQSGFSLIEGLLVLALIGILGFTGWYVRYSETTSDKTSNIKYDAQACDDSEFPQSRYCISTAKAQTTVFSKLPTKLQKLAISEIEKQTPACVKSGQIVDYSGKPVDPEVKYAQVGSAIIGIGCDSGSAGLFARDLKSGEWVYVEKTQLAFSCGAVLQYPVPKMLLEFGQTAECIDSQGNIQSYQSEFNKSFY